MTIKDRGIAEWEEWMQWEDKWNSVGLSTKEYQTQKSTGYKYRKGKERGGVLQCNIGESLNTLGTLNAIIMRKLFQNTSWDTYYIL